MKLTLIQSTHLRFPVIHVLICVCVFISIQFYHRCRLVITTIVKIEKSYITTRIPLVILSLPPTPSSKPLNFLPAIIVIISRILCKFYHTVCSLWGLAFFTQYASKNHLGYWVYQWFIPFYHCIIFHSTDVPQFV